MLQQWKVFSPLKRISRDFFGDLVEELKIQKTSEIYDEFKYYIYEKSQDSPFKFSEGTLLSLSLTEILLAKLENNF